MLINVFFCVKCENYEEFYLQSHSVWNVFLLSGIKFVVNGTIQQTGFNPSGSACNKLIISVGFIVFYTYPSAMMWMCAGSVGKCGGLTAFPAVWLFLNALIKHVLIFCGRSVSPLWWHQGTAH